MIAALAAGAAAAQVAPAQPDAAPDAKAAAHARAAPPEIVVSGQRAAITSTIDRKSYVVSSDLQSAGGSVSEVLRNLPAVDVDAQGNVSLRGDANVQVLIDGKPSTTMSGANRAETLQSLPADAIDRIEVITNPSARFRPDGGAGIINIVTKRNRAAGLTGSARASGGSDGRFNFGSDVTWHKGKWTVAANAALRRDVPLRPLHDERAQIDPATGLATVSRQDNVFTSPRLMKIVGGSVDYDATARDRVTLAAKYSNRTGSPRIDQTNVVFGPGGAPASAFTRTGRGSEEEVNDEVSAKYRHSFADKGHDFSLDLRRGQTIENQLRRFTNSYSIPAGLVTIDQQGPRADERQAEATAEYNQPLAGGAWLLGYDIERDDSDYRNRGDQIDPNSGIATVDPSRTNRFTYRRTIQALYSTYEHKVAKRLTAQLGLRLEWTAARGNQVDLALANRDSYFRVYPTGHFDYDLGHDQSLRLSYSRRVNRPEAEDLNPYPLFSNPLNLRSGNPALKPEEITSYELGYLRDRGGNAFEATFFLRRTTNGFTEVSRFLSPTVLLTTQANLGRSEAAGVDVTDSGKLGGWLSYRLSASVYRNAIDATNLGFPGTRTGWSWTLKPSLDFKATKRDLAQLIVNYRGKKLTAQGYRAANTTVDLGFRHEFANGMAAVLAISDLFDTREDHVVIDSPGLREDSVWRYTRRTATLTFSVPIGRGKRKPAAAPIEFGG